MARISNFKTFGLMLLPAFTVGCIKGSFTLHRGAGAARSSNKFALANCKDPDLKYLRKGEMFSLCNGTTAEGQLDVCTKDNQIDCIPENTFKATDAKNLVADKFAYGASPAGIAGTKRAMKICLNGYNHSSFDASATADIAPYFSFTTNAGADTINFSTYTHLLAEGTQVFFTTNGTLPGNITASTHPGGPYNYFYVRNPTTTTFQISTTPTGGIFDITALAGGGFHFMYRVGDGIAQYYESIDDFNAGAATSPQLRYFGDKYVCDETSFANVTNSAADLKPSGAVPTHAANAFSEIWFDSLSGLYFSNVLYTGAGAKNWPTYYAMCNALNGGTAGNGWRLPSEKEMMQLYVDGISRVAVGGGTLDNYFATLTTASLSRANHWRMNLAKGWVNHAAKTATTDSVLCVR